MEKQDNCQCAVPQGETPITWEQIGKGMWFCIKWSVIAFGIWGAIGYWFGWDNDSTQIVALFLLMCCLLFTPIYLDYKKQYPDL